jgi:hypothetical protein
MKKWLWYTFIEDSTLGLLKGEEVFNPMEFNNQNTLVQVLIWMGMSLLRAIVMLVYSLPVVLIFLVIDYFFKWLPAQSDPEFLELVSEVAKHGYALDVWLFILFIGGAYIALIMGVYLILRAVVNIVSFIYFGILDKESWAYNYFTK